MAYLLPILAWLLFVILPLTSLIFFIVSLILYFSAKKKNRTSPGSVDENRLHTLKLRTIISGVIALVLIAAVGTLVALFFIALAHM